MPRRGRERTPARLSIGGLSAHSARPAHRPARSRVLGLATVAASAILLTAGCSGGSSSSGPATTAAAGPTSTSVVTTTTIPITDVFPSLSDKTKTADVKITYASALGPAATLAQDGTGKSSFLSNGSLLISDGTRVVRCDGTTAAATCSDLGPTSSDDALTQLISAYAGLSTLKTSSVGKDSSETIVGRPASCVTFKASDYAAAVGGTLPDASKISAAATVTVCVDDDSGFAVKIALADRGNSVNELIATQVGPSSPSDFVPPSSPVTIPALATTTTTRAG